MRADRELLEKVAKAAGLTIDTKPWCKAVERDGLILLNDRGGHSFWNPLTDDGDALRLLAALRLDLDYRPGYVGVHRGFGPYIGQCPHDDNDEQGSAATRRAIVRAAAALCDVKESRDEQ